EMKTYEKVASLLAGGTAVQGGVPVGAATPQVPQVCSIIPRVRVVQCWPIFRTPIINVECGGCGPCAGGGFSGFGGGFGSFGRQHNIMPDGPVAAKACSGSCLGDDGETASDPQSLQAVTIDDVRRESWTLCSPSCPLQMWDVQPSASASSRPRSRNSAS